MQTWSAPIGQDATWRDGHKRNLPKYHTCHSIIQPLGRSSEPRSNNVPAAPSPPGMFVSSPATSSLILRAPHALGVSWLPPGRRDPPRPRTLYVRTSNRPSLATMNRVDQPSPFGQLPCGYQPRDLRGQRMEQELESAGRPLGVPEAFSFSMNHQPPSHHPPTFAGGNGGRGSFSPGRQTDLCQNKF